MAFAPKPLLSHVYVLDGSDNRGVLNFDGEELSLVWPTGSLYSGFRVPIREVSRAVVLSEDGKLISMWGLELTVRGLKYRVMLEYEADTFRNRFAWAYLLRYYGVPVPLWSRPALPLRTALLPALCALLAVFLLVFWLYLWSYRG